jgi:hypothetical protein
MLRRRFPLLNELARIPSVPPSTVEQTVVKEMSYCIFFRAQGAIVGRDDFGAESDQAATIIAEALCDACSDSCDGFELWQGSRAVGARHASLVQIDAGRLTAQMQAAVIQHEELLRDSRWAVAKSRRLLALTRRTP